MEIYLAENLRAFRIAGNMTQEDVARSLGVAPQTVSKWERQETCPDITLLPALAHLFSTSVDALLGMDRIGDARRIGRVYDRARAHLRAGAWDKAVSVYEEALQTWAGHPGLLSDLAMALALRGDRASLEQAWALCEEVLRRADAGEKVFHTARAALCYILHLLGEKEQAATAARLLPHVRESREILLGNLAADPSEEAIRAFIFELSLGEPPV